MSLPVTSALEYAERQIHDTADRENAIKRQAPLHKVIKTKWAERFGNTSAGGT